MKIYIAGPMTGIPEYNRPAFFQAAEDIAGQGHIPLNPAVLPDGLSEPDYMCVCLAMLQRADAVHMLDGWRNSQGARAEYGLARKLGLNIFVPA